MSSAFELNPDIAKLAFGSVLLMIECAFGGSGVMKQRSKYFTPEFLQQFEKGEFKPAKQGYPDMGNGHYADKLSFEGWFNLNIAQRVHGNFQEWLPIWLILLWVSSIKYPSFSAYMSFGFFVTRGLYLVGYKSSPNKRGLGAIPFFLMMFSCIYTTGSTIYSLIQGE